MRQIPWPGEQSSFHIVCECGRMVTLYYNGGELDREACSCGRVYEAFHLGTAVEVTEP